MIQGPEVPLLGNWQNFYMLMGAAAATLTGLTFVAITLIVGFQKQASILDAGIAAFNTPTVVHFCLVLLIAGILSAPWQAYSTIRLVLGILSLGMMFYLSVVMRRLRQMPDYHTPVKDWLWFITFPLAAYIVLIVAAIVLPANPALALYMIGAAMIGLLFVAIHNAWDLLIYFAVERSQSENKRDA